MIQSAIAEPFNGPYAWDNTVRVVLVAVATLLGLIVLRVSFIRLRDPDVPDHEGWGLFSYGAFIVFAISTVLIRIGTERLDWWRVAVMVVALAAGYGGVLSEVKFRWWHGWRDDDEDR